MGKKAVALEGNQAVALAMKQCRPDVVAAYPITPQTEVVQYFSQYVQNGEVHTEFVPVESEHSAMSACVGASASGARAMTATSSQGLALMWEILYIASALRLPIVMAVVNRALSANINIHCDHSDAMGARDTGWIQLFSENAQEAYDNMIQAVRIAEHPEVLLPVMVNYDGFIVSHSVETMEVLDDEEVAKFVGEREAEVSLLDIEHPVTMGPLDFTDFYFEHKRQQLEAYRSVPRVIEEVGRQYGELSGREYGLLEAYRMGDAEVALVIMGSASGTAKVAVDERREAGEPVGLVKIRAFRPFPVGQLVDLLGKVRAVAVLDRATSPGAEGGPLYMEVRSALYDLERRPPIMNIIYGLGGRDISLDHFHEIIDWAKEAAEAGKAREPVRFVGVRE
ncbi:MAG TPA: pyruvate ferredoxin oxidoreductase [Armatimonadetes bacterium]|nr:pyruvate ferredoxin oxidoreductase [Armatimonadota bacterium]